MRGRRNEKVQTEKCLEDLAYNPYETDVACQTDLYLERPATPPFVPTKTGIDVAVQVDEPVEGFDMDRELRLVIDDCVARAVVEVAQDTVDQENNSPEHSARNPGASAGRNEKRTSAANILQGYVADLLPSILNSIKSIREAENNAELKKQLAPWLAQEISQEVGQIIDSRELLKELVKEILLERAELYVAGDDNRVGADKINLFEDDTFDSQENGGGAAKPQFPEKIENVLSRNVDILEQLERPVQSIKLGLVSKSSTTTSDQVTSLESDDVASEGAVNNGPVAENSVEEGEVDLDERQHTTEDQIVEVDEDYNENNELTGDSQEKSSSIDQESVEPNFNIEITPKSMLVKDKKKEENGKQMGVIEVEGFDPVSKDDADEADNAVDNVEVANLEENNKRRKRHSEDDTTEEPEIVALERSEIMKEDQIEMVEDEEKESIIDVCLKESEIKKEVKLVNEETVKAQGNSNDLQSPVDEDFREEENIFIKEEEIDQESSPTDEDAELKTRNVEISLRSPGIIREADTHTGESLVSETNESNVQSDERELNAESISTSPGPYNKNDQVKINDETTLQHDEHAEVESSQVDGGKEMSIEDKQPESVIILDKQGEEELPSKKTSDIDSANNIIENHNHNPNEEGEKKSPAIKNEEETPKEESKEELLITSPNVPVSTPPKTDQKEEPKDPDQTLSVLTESNERFEETKSDSKVSELRPEDCPEIKISSISVDNDTTTLSILSRVSTPHLDSISYPDDDLLDLIIDGNRTLSKDEITVRTAPESSSTTKSAHDETDNDEDKGSTFEIIEGAEVLTIKRKPSLEEVVDEEMKTQTAIDNANEHEKEEEEEDRVEVTEICTRRTISALTSPVTGDSASAEEEIASNVAENTEINVEPEEVITLTASPLKSATIPESPEAESQADTNRSIITPSAPLLDLLDKDQDSTTVNINFSETVPETDKPSESVSHPASCEDIDIYRPVSGSSNPDVLAIVNYKQVSFEAGQAENFSSDSPSVVSAYAFKVDEHDNASLLNAFCSDLNAETTEVTFVPSSPATTQKKIISFDEGERAAVASFVDEIEQTAISIVQSPMELSSFIYDQADQTVNAKLESSREETGEVSEEVRKEMSQFVEDIQKQAELALAQPLSIVEELSNYHDSNKIIITEIQTQDNQQLERASPQGHHIDAKVDSLTLPKPLPLPSSNNNDDSEMEMDSLEVPIGGNRDDEKDDNDDVVMDSDSVEALASFANDDENATEKFITPTPPLGHAESLNRTESDTTTTAVEVNNDPGRVNPIHDEDNEDVQIFPTKDGKL